jgi:hypothetical protein
MDHLKTSGGENNDSDLDISFGLTGHEPPSSSRCASSSMVLDIFKSNSKEDNDTNKEEDHDHDEHVVPY